MGQPSQTTEIQDTFRTLALQLGGIAVLHSLDDAAVWALARAIDTAYRKSLQSFSRQPARKRAATAAPAKHPGIVHLLDTIEKLN